jgi:fructuronate reductase
LSLHALAQVPETARPALDPRSRRPGVVHLGIGAFHRAHQAVYTEDSGDWAICGVTQRSASVLDQLAPQDGLYGLLVRDDGRREARVIGAVREVLHAGADPAAVVARIADAPVVTLTVTEKGYRHDPATGRLRLADPEIVADLSGRPPRTVVGQLVAGLATRRAATGAPATVVCCDNLPSNGTTVRGLVGEYAARLDETLAGWIAANVAFPCTMVDRIVPSATDTDRADAAALLGVDDAGTVVAEPFTQWVIEDSFAGPRPDWEKAGATLAPDVAPYETVKLRMLNGSHSTLAYLGGLAGYVTIAEAVADPVLAELVGRLMAEDVVPTLTAPDGLDLDSYGASVRARFANPALRHRTAQVAMDGTQKLPQRLLGTVRDRYAAGATPYWATLAVAAWMRYVATQPVDDPLAELLAERVNGATSAPGVVGALLGIRQVFGDDLPAHDGFRSLLTEYVAALAGQAPLEAVRTALAGKR